MKKYIVVLLVSVTILIGILCFFPYQERPATTPANMLTLPVIQDNYWDLYDINCDIIFEAGFFASNSIRFTLLSATPLEQTDITVTTNTSWDIVYYLDPYDGKDGKCVMYEDLLLMYQGVSANELLDYSSGTLSSERKEEINFWLNSYRELDDNEKPTIYRYVLELLVSSSSEDSNSILDEITVTVRGEPRTYHLGTILDRMDKDADLATDPNYRLNCDENLAYFGYSVGVSKDGDILLQNIKYTAIDDVEITGIRFYNREDVEIQSVSIIQHISDGATIDIAWDMTQPIELHAGDSIYLNTRITDSFFAESLGGWDTRYLMLEYLSDGETYELGIPFYFVQSLSDPFAYIAMEDGIDVLSYYLNYANKLRG